MEKKQRAISRLEIAILAGGSSSRMGKDKSLLPLGQRPLILHVSEALKGIGSRIRIITANPQHGRLTKLPTQEDLIVGKGPLSGIHAALVTAREPWVFVAACDLPFLTAALVRGLAQYCTNQFDAIVPCPESLPIPVAALYRSTCVRTCEDLLTEGTFTSRILLDRLNVRQIHDRELAHLGIPEKCFLNINTPQDLQLAEKLLNTTGHLVD